MEPKLFTVPEAAKILNISERTVWDLIKAKKLSVIRFTKRTVRVSMPAIDGLISASETQANRLVFSYPVNYGAAVPEQKKPLDTSGAAVAIPR